LSTRPPKGLQATGKRLWRGITEHLELDEHETALLVEACRTADAIDALQTVIETEGAMLHGRAHPALVEGRQQRLTLARLIASMRLPDDLAAPVKRPQRRGGARGAYLREVS